MTRKEEHVTSWLACFVEVDKVGYSTSAVKLKTAMAEEHVSILPQSEILACEWDYRHMGKWLVKPRLAECKTDSRDDGIKVTSNISYAGDGVCGTIVIRWASQEPGPAALEKVVKGGRTHHKKALQLYKATRLV